MARNNDRIRKKKRGEVEMGQPGKLGGTILTPGALLAPPVGPDTSS
jgi:hypothetical protein